MQVGDKVIVSTSRGIGLFGKVVKFTEKRILVRTNFAPEENLKKHYGNKFPVSQYYRPEKVTRKEWK